MRRLGIAALGAIAALALGVGTANAATVENGNFETGDLEGWQEDFFGPGAWDTYTAFRQGGMAFPAPPQGDFAAVSEQGMPSAQFMSQVVKLKGGQRHTLKVELAYQNNNTDAPRGAEFPGFWTPNHFRFGENARPNQQFRMDVMKPGAPIKSLKAKHILERVYITERGDANFKSYRTIKENLSEHAGKKVRLRFAVVVTEAELHVGVDRVRIRSKND